MVEVYTRESGASTGKPLFCLSEKQGPFIHHYTGKHARFSPEFSAIDPGGIAQGVHAGGAERKRRCCQQ